MSGQLPGAPGTLGMLGMPLLGMPPGIFPPQSTRSGEPSAVNKIGHETTFQ
jgi:hypothetical protein